MLSTTFAQRSRLIGEQTETRPLAEVDDQRRKSCFGEAEGDAQSATALESRSRGTPSKVSDGPPCNRLVYRMIAGMAYTCCWSSS